MQVYVQVIRVETSPGIVETCNLTQIEQVASEEAARLAAMHHVGPIHTFMFSGTGRLLMANKRGRERYQHISKPPPYRPAARNDCSAAFGCPCLHIELSVSADRHGKSLFLLIVLGRRGNMSLGKPFLCYFTPSG